jgi:transcription antitermination factor NusG
MSKLQVTDTEMKAYYDAHKDEFATVPSVTLREITINVPTTPQGINVAADDAAKAKAEEVRAKILANEPFARLAADYSDSGSKANGGLVGPLAKSDLSEDLQKAIAGLKTGGVTPVIRTTRGYQIIKIENLQDSTTKPFDEARGDIADKIANGKRQGEYRKFIIRLRAEAIIDWKNDEIKKAYEVGLKQEEAETPQPYMDPRWYAIWTRSRHEKIVRDQLEKKGDVDVFLPTIGKWSRWKDRKKKIDWPLFPGYVFARFVADERIGVLKVDGVVQIISNNGMLSPIPEEEIESIRTLVESELAYDPVPLIKEGDMVRVAHGPLKGVVGRLIRKGAHARLILSVDLIGQAVSVEVDAADVKPY